MVSHPFFYQLALIALVWLYVMLLYAWPSDRVVHLQPADNYLVPKTGYNAPYHAIVRGYAMIPHQFCYLIRLSWDSYGSFACCMLPGRAKAG
jgi:hypothetical protein